MKNKLLIVIIILLPILPMIAGFLILIYPTIEDRSLNREKMYYDLGEGYKVTVMLKDSLAYIMPYMYKGKELPTEDYYVIKRSADENISGGKLTFEDKNSIIITTHQDIFKLNFENIKYKYLRYTDILYPESLDFTSDVHGYSNYYGRASKDDKRIMDSLFRRPNFGVLFMGKPFIVDIRRVEGDKITFHRFRGSKEDKNMSYVIKE